MLRESVGRISPLSGLSEQAITDRFATNSFVSRIFSHEPLSSFSFLCAFEEVQIVGLTSVLARIELTGA